MLSGRICSCKWITWSRSQEGGIPLGISPNTLEWFLITIWIYNGSNDIDFWTQSEYNCVITPRGPFLSNFVMLLELITLYGFPSTHLFSISLPYEKNIMKISWKLGAIVPNDCNHWNPNTTLEPPFGWKSWDYPKNTPPY